MSVIAQRQKNIVEEFAVCPDWEARYKKIIQMGRELSPLNESLKIEANKVQGCQSQVWIHAQPTAEGQIIFQADSDALITRGLVGLLLQVYSQASFEEVIAEPPAFIAELGLSQHLSPSRANGLMSMVKKMKYYAMAFQALAQSPSR